MGSGDAPMTSRRPRPERTHEPVTKLADLSRLCRELVSAIHTSENPDMLHDYVVDRVLQDIRDRGDAGRVAQMLGAMIVFAHDRVTTAQTMIGVHAMTVDDLETWAARETGIDPALVADCLAIVREMTRRPRHAVALRWRIQRAIATWGPYALACEAVIYLSIAARAATDAGITVDQLIRSWAMSEEQMLTGSATPPTTETWSVDD